MADEPLSEKQVAQIALTIADVLWPVGGAPNTSADRAKCAVATALRRGFPSNDACHMPAVNMISAAPEPSEVIFGKLAVAEHALLVARHRLAAGACGDYAVTADEGLLAIRAAIAALLAPKGS
jgi:hypothetical protein